MTKVTLVIALMFSIDLSADLIADGYAEIKEHDYTNARVLWAKACDSGNADGCYNLGLMYEYGDGVQPDKETADYFYKRACNMGSDRGCYGYVNRTDSHSATSMQ